MRIFFAIDGLGRGGKERQLSILYSSLDKNKYEKNIVAKRIAPGNNYLKEYNISEDEIILSDGFLQFFRTVKKYKPDLIFTWDLQSSLYSLLLMMFFKFKFINGSIRHGVRGNKPDHYVRSLVAWLSPAVVANSNAGLLANDLKQGKNRIVLYNGIEEKFKERISFEEKVNGLKNIFPDYTPEKEIVFISVANFVPYKDYFTVLDSLNNVKDEMSFRYLIVGDGPLRGEIEQKISALGLDKKIHITGKSSNVEYYLKLSDVMLHSSKGEGVSNAILEGMYAGLPVIASEVGGIPETVYKPFSLLFSYKNINDLTDCLLKAKDLRKKFNVFNFSDAGYREHLNKFTLENMVNNFQKILSEKLH